MISQSNTETCGACRKDTISLIFSRKVSLRYLELSMRMNWANHIDTQSDADQKVFTMFSQDMTPDVSRNPTYLQRSPLPYNIEVLDKMNVVAYVDIKSRM